MTPGLLDRTALGGELRALADRPGLAHRQEELRELGLALSGAGDLDRWAELDLVHSFVRPESVRAAVRPRPAPRFWAWAEAALGGLVFVPLLVTWGGLMQASSAYRALIGADPRQAARPFLQLWQTGFEGRLPGWAGFGDIARSATLFIALLLALSVAHGLRRAGTERREAAAEAEAEDLLAELAPLLTRAQLVLNERRRSTPQRFAAELTGAAETLERLVRQAADTQRDLGAAAVAVERSVAGAELRLAEAGEAVDPLRRAVDGVEKAVDGIGRAVDGVGRAVKDSGDRLAETVRDGAAATDSLVHRSGSRPPTRSTWSGRPPTGSVPVSRTPGSGWRTRCGTSRSPSAASPPARRPSRTSAGRCWSGSTAWHGRSWRWRTGWPPRPRRPPPRRPGWTRRPTGGTTGPRGS